MSSNRFKNIKPKLQDVLRKDLTPKSSKLSNKFSPVYSSFRANNTMKQQLNSKVKISRPATSKHANENNNQNYFRSNNRDERKNGYSSNKKIPKDQIIRGNVHKNAYEYQPRSKSKSPAKQPEQIVRQQIFIQPQKFNIQTREIRHYNNDKVSLPKFLSPITNFQKAKHSGKANGFIKAYAASTNQGPVRQYNEDRVAIILNISKPQHCTEWKKAAYFGVFDGHGGVDCADFLRDNLHVFVSREKTFPNDMESALKNGFDKCERLYVEQSRSNKVDKSGSCAIVTFFYGDKCYIANVGDSRAILSSRWGEVASELSLDHKASDQFQQKRIIERGGKIYQTKLQNSNPKIKILYEGEQHNYILGPHRVFPGRLSVTRTFGDIEAKIPQLGGNPYAIVNEPEVRTITISSQQDFIILASDGIYDKMSNSDIIQMVWQTFQRQKGKYRNLHQFCGLAVQNIMRLAFHKKTLDNITVVLVVLEGLERYFNQLELPKQNSLQKTMTIDKKVKGSSKHESSFERKYIGRSTSPSSNYTSVRTQSFYKH